MKKRIVLLLTILGTATFLSSCGIKQTADAVTVEAGQELQLQATDFFDIKEENAGDITFDTSKVDVNKVGEYEVTAAYKKDTYTIKVTVEDTTAPSVELKQRYVFTNDIAAYEPTELVDSIYDASEYTVKFARFEKTGDLDVMDDAAIKALTDTIPIPGDQKALAEVGSEEIPTEEGIYRSILAVADEHGNTQLEEVYVILDKTGALIEDVADKTIEVDAADIDKEPEVDKSEYKITDKVDGVISADAITCELKLTDEEKHQYTVYVSYADRAGNESKAEFLINVTEKKEEVASNEGSGNGGSDNSQNNSGSGNESADSGNQSSGGDWTEGKSYEEIISEDPAYYETHLTPAQEAAVNAGYYNVVAVDGGYIVMVHDGEFSYGSQLLEEYLANMGYAPRDMSGGYIDASKDQYGVSVSSEWLVPLVTEEDEEFWN